MSGLPSMSYPDPTWPRAPQALEFEYCNTKTQFQEESSPCAQCQGLKGLNAFQGTVPLGSR